MVSAQWPQICTCDEFTFWYAITRDSHPDLPLRVCECGHRDSEHLDSRGSCTGETVSLK